MPRHVAITLLAAALLGPLYADQSQAGALVATRTLRAGTTIAAQDVTMSDAATPPGGATDPQEVIGQEARVTLYSGRPIPLAALGPPALVERNQLVTLSFRRGGLNIRADGRALGRGAEGDVIRVMNLASHSTISGTVAGPGLVSVP